jgi:ATP-binding cassette subfamily C protein
MVLPFILIIARPGTDPTGDVPLLSSIGQALAALGLPPSPAVFFMFFAVLLVLKSAASVGLTHYTAATSAEVMQVLRTRLAASVLVSEWRFLSRQRTGALSAMVSHEINAVGQAFSDFASLAAMALQITIYLALAITLSWQIAMLALLILVVVILFFNAIIRYRQHLAQLQLEATNHLAAQFSDIVSSLKVFRGMGRVSSVLRTINAASRTTSDRFSQRVISSELSVEILEPLVGLMVIGWFYAALFWFGFVLANVLVVGILLIRVIYLYLTFYRALFRINDGRAQLRDILDLVATATAEVEARPGTRPVTGPSPIAIERLSFTYDGTPVFDDFSLDIPFGSIIAISGPSGVGKSTLLDLLLALRLPTGGDIRIGGASLFHEIDVSQWRRTIGFVPQEQVLHNASVLENLTFGEVGLSRMDAHQALVAAHAWDFVSALPDGLDQGVGERGQFLSGGQRQRIAIARALIRRPDLLILDEATTALDPATEQQIIANILALHRERPFTIIAVTHQDGWRSIADRVIDLGSQVEPATA